MVMKVAHTMSISPASSVYDLWSGTYTINEFDNDALTIGTGTKTYKSSVVDNWSNYQISAVGLSQNSQLLNIRRTTPSSVKVKCIFVTISRAVHTFEKSTSIKIHVLPKLFSNDLIS